MNENEFKSYSRSTQTTNFFEKIQVLYVDSGFVKPCDELVIGYSRMWQR